MAFRKGKQLEMVCGGERYVRDPLVEAPGGVGKKSASVSFLPFSLLSVTDC